LLGGSKTTVTRRFPQAGHMRRDSSLESGKFGPRVQTSVSKSKNKSADGRFAQRPAIRRRLDELINSTPLRTSADIAGTVGRLRLLFALTMGCKIQ
jgi:hypothetical protein